MPAPFRRSCTGLFVALVASASAAAQEIGHARGHQDVTIEYEVISRGSPTLVFVHGWMCDRTFWRQQSAHFSANYGVVLLDLGGHGRSGSDRTDWTISSFAHDVSGVIRELDLRDVVLAGHSMGGPVVAEAALLEPTRIRGVIGVDTYQYLEASWLAGNGVPQLVNALQRNFAGTARGFVQSMFTPDSDSALVRTITETMVSGSEAVGIPSTESMFEWYRDRGVAALNEIQQPMWTINSAEYVGTDVERLRQQVPRLHVTLMRGVGHFVMLEAPDEFNRHLDDAVAAVISNRGQR